MTVHTNEHVEGAIANSVSIVLLQGMSSTVHSMHVEGAIANSFEDIVLLKEIF